MTPNRMNHWHVYILHCADDTLYTGITTDLQRRLAEHNEGRLGARYTRTRRPVSLVYSECCADRSAASVREAQIKRLRRAAKDVLIAEARICVPAK